MTNHNAINERIKRQYFLFLKEAKRHNEATVDAVAKALSRFEEYNKHKDFKKFHLNQAVAFKNHLAVQRKHNSDEKLSKATLNSTMGHLKRFFQWLSCQPGYKSRIPYSDADYFNLSEKDTRIANTSQPRKVPTLEQVKCVLEKMPTDSDIALRNKAIIAFTILTGMRDNAIASLKLKHINMMSNSVYQDARDVRTKFSKTFTTYFFPVGDEIRQIVDAWVSHLRENLLWGNDDPLFPATKIVLGSKRHFEAQGLKRLHWSNANSIRSIFKEAFTVAGLPYFNPHSFRNTLVALGEKICRSPEEFKAWSQNLGHEQVLTTFCSYGEVPEQRQSEIIQCLSQDTNRIRPDYDELANVIVERLKKEAV